MRRTQADDSKHRFRKAYLWARSWVWCYHSDGRLGCAGRTGREVRGSGRAERCERNLFLSEVTSPYEASQKRRATPVPVQSYSDGENVPRKQKLLRHQFQKPTPGFRPWSRATFTTPPRRVKTSDSILLTTRSPVSEYQLCGGGLPYLLSARLQPTTVTDIQNLEVVENIRANSYHVRTKKKQV